jgi:hypothetical protein
LLCQKPTGCLHPHNTYSLLEEAHGSISLPHKDARTQPGDQDRMSELEL